MWYPLVRRRADGRGRSSKRLIPRIFFNNSLDITLSLTLGLCSSFLCTCGTLDMPVTSSPVVPSLTLPSCQPTARPTSSRRSSRLSAHLRLVPTRIHLSDSQPISTLDLRSSLKSFEQKLVSCSPVHLLLTVILTPASDLQQLWHERRLIVRARSQLTGEVYEKALKRLDLSGVVAPKEDEPVKGKKKSESPSATSTGKIVSLMTADTTRVSNQLMGLSSIVAAPFELAIAITFLYSYVHLVSLHIVVLTVAGM